MVEGKSHAESFDKKVKKERGRGARTGCPMDLTSKYKTDFKESGQEKKKVRVSWLGQLKSESKKSSKDKDLAVQSHQQTKYREREKR